MRRSTAWIALVTAASWMAASPARADFFRLYLEEIGLQDWSKGPPPSYAFIGKLRVERHGGVYDPPVGGVLLPHQAELDSFSGFMTISARWNAGSSEATESMKVEGQIQVQVSAKLKCFENPWLSKDPRCTVISANQNSNEVSAVHVRWQEVYTELAKPISSGNYPETLTVGGNTKSSSRSLALPEPRLLASKVEGQAQAAAPGRQAVRGSAAGSVAGPVVTAQRVEGRQAAPRPLAAPLKIDLGKVGARPLGAPDWEGLAREYGELQQSYSHYEFTYKQYIGAFRACVEKNHSAQDQQAAGCTPDDTLAECSVKLYNRCLQHPNRGSAESAARSTAEKAAEVSRRARELGPQVGSSLPQPR